MLQHATRQRSLYTHTNFHSSSSQDMVQINKMLYQHIFLVKLHEYSCYISQTSSTGLAPKGEDSNGEIFQKNLMEPQVFPVFSALKRNIREKNSVTVSSRSPGCSTAIERLISALTARGLQRFAPVPTRADRGNTENMQLLSYE